MATPLVTFDRDGGASYYDKNGVEQTVPADTPRYAYDPDNGKYRGLLSYGNYVHLNVDSGLDVQGNQYTKTDGGDQSYNRSVSSEFRYGSGTKITATIVDPNPRVFIGLGETNPDSDYHSITWAWFLYQENDIRIYRNNGGTINPDANMVVGDVFEVEYVDDTVYYSRNGELVYSESIGTGRLLYLDTSFYNLNAPIKIDFSVSEETITFDSKTDWYEPESSTFYTEIYHQEHNIGQPAQIIGMNDQTGFIMRGADETVYIDYGDGERLYAPGQLYRNQANKVAASITATGRRIALNGRSAEDGVTAQVVDFDSVNELSDALYLNNGYIRTKYFAQTFSLSELDQLTKL